MAETAASRLQERHQRHLDRTGALVDGHRRHVEHHHKRVQQLREGGDQVQAEGAADGQAAS